MSSTAITIGQIANKTHYLAEAVMPIALGHTACDHDLLAGYAIGTGVLNIIEGVSLICSNHNKIFDQRITSERLESLKAQTQIKHGQIQIFNGFVSIIAGLVNELVGTDLTLAFLNAVLACNAMVRLWLLIDSAPSFKDHEFDQTIRILFNGFEGLFFCILAAIDQSHEKIISLCSSALFSKGVVSSLAMVASTGFDYFCGPEKPKAPSPSHSPR